MHEIGDQIPAFELPDTRGAAHAAPLDEAPPATVVIVMCNHCPYVVAWNPRLKAVAEDYGDRGVRFLGINVKDDKQLADAFLQSKGITFPSLYDPRGEVALAFRDYPANAIPSTIVLDRDGRVAAVYTAAVKPEDLQTVVDRVVKEG